VTAAEERFLSLEDVAARLQVSDQTVRRWIKSGKLTAYKPGLEYRIREADLQEFLRAREVRPKAPRRSPFEPSFDDLPQAERSLRYLRVLDLFAASMDRLWAGKVEQDVFSQQEFEDGVDRLRDFEDAYVRGVGTDLLAALRAYEGSLPEDYPEAEREALRAYALAIPEDERLALEGAKASINAWHRTMWRASDVLRDRGGASVTQLDEYRERLQASNREWAEAHTERAASE
jgi:excisionase family DNA binding protein